MLQENCKEVNRSGNPGYRKGDSGMNLDEDKVDLNDPLNDIKKLL